MSGLGEFNDLGNMLKQEDNFPKSLLTKKSVVPIGANLVVFNHDSTDIEEKIIERQLREELVDYIIKNTPITKTLRDNGSVEYSMKVNIVEDKISLKQPRQETDELMFDIGNVLNNNRNQLTLSSEKILKAILHDIYRGRIIKL